MFTIQTTHHPHFYKRGNYLSFHFISFFFFFQITFPMVIIIYEPVFILVGFRFLIYMMFVYVWRRENNHNHFFLLWILSASVCVYIQHLMCVIYNYFFFFTFTKKRLFKLEARNKTSVYTPLIARVSLSLSLSIWRCQ